MTTGSVLTKIVGVYDADGGAVGETKYFVGHLLGRLECSLCDITHGPVRRKKSFDEFRSRLSVPFEGRDRGPRDGDGCRQVGSTVRVEISGGMGMTLQVVGAGAGRTGTHSLKVALEQLCGGTCHHMIECFGRPDQIAGFTAAADGQPVDWTALMADFTAMVDFPGSLFWREIAAANPDAPILLSSRDAEGWYTSASNTIFVSMDSAPPEMQPWMQAVKRMLRDRFSDDFENKGAMIAAYEAHNAAVRSEVPADRLIDWTPGDGWGPICAALNVPVPDEPFPLTNTTKEFREMIGAPPLS